MKDPYLDKNGVLKNKLHIDNEKELKQAEADIGFLKIINVDSVSFTDFDENLIKSIHKHIFGDIYDWAGVYRKMPLFKEEIVLPGYSIPYSDYSRIDRELKERLKELNQVEWQNLSVSDISYQFARKIALIWKVHPFRDGNTRTMLAFSFLFAKYHGFPFDIKRFTSELNREYQEDGKVSKYSIRDKFVLACLDDKDYPEVEFLAYVFQHAIEEEKISDKKSQK